MEYRPLGRTGVHRNHRGNSRRWIITEVENSLRRLNTDWIDLYQIHRPDPDTDIEDTLGALSDLVHQGKLRYIGSSSFSAGQIVEAQWTARQHGLQRFRTEQPPCSILVRGIELDVLPTALRQGMGSISLCSIGLTGLVAPGVVLNPADTGYGEQVLEPSLRRR